MRHFLLSLAICLSSSVSLMAEELRYCLYWPVYIDGGTALYVSDMIDISNAYPCSDAYFCYYWADSDDPNVPENCPNCVHTLFARAANVSSKDQPAKNDPFAGLRKPFSSKSEFAQLVPTKWQRIDADAEGTYTWNPRDGVTCQNSRVVTVKTELGEKVQVKIFDLKFSPGRAGVIQSSAPSKTAKLGYEITDASQSNVSTYVPKKMPNVDSAYQGVINVDGANYTIISKAPLFRE
ncbi:hypothetical protein [Schlesneria sp. T3-172]|uniref:hypothetical protein n=1 Tax=Schlesneria sphaerica TaxID=3373610 RepID=UPI0037CAA0C7